jgi:23S rRNA (adenine2030-N6)-methyltransferase
MNYRHAFHAGNVADVLKHAVLTLVIGHLKRKETPFFILDTHAGIGAYDLQADEARRTGEWRDGIGRVLAAPDPPPDLAPYLAAARAEPGRYPGSPALARGLMRPGDRLALVELHAEDFGRLRGLFSGDRQVAIRHEDGYKALKSLLPPPERRGLVLIDPPYEVADEWDRLLAGLRQGLARWRTGTYLLWYPIKAGGADERFRADLMMADLPPTLAVELIIRPRDATGLAGSGLAVVNPPWMLEEQLGRMLPWLAGAMAPGAGDWRLDWLVEERS